MCLGPLGLKPNEWPTLTPHEFFALLEAEKWRHRHRHEEDARLAWMIRMAVNAKRLKFKDLLPRKETTLADIKQAKTDYQDIAKELG